jgi:hypothetical protein
MSLSQLIASLLKKKKGKKSNISFCLDCEGEVDLGPDPKVGQRVKCPCRKVELEVVNLEPLELDWVYMFFW